MAGLWRQLCSSSGSPARCCLNSHRNLPMQTLAGVGRMRRFHAPSVAAISKILRVSDEVADALATKRPVVALESTIYTHGAMGEDLRLEAIVRENGAVPAVIGVLDGQANVGLLPAEIERMVEEGAQKASRRDLAQLVGRGGKRQGRHGGTTISGTMVLARLAGIRVFGTGGLGGVHRGWQEHMDISADLSELGRTRVAVVSSGSKGFLDTAATLEYLETQGVYVATFADGRVDKDVRFPAFWARESSLPSPSVVQDEAEAAAIIRAQELLGIETGLLFANAIPEAYAVPRAEMEAAIDTAVREAAEQGFSGNRNTPFVLRRIRELTNNRSVAANLALVQDNVRRAARVAVELSALEAAEHGGDDSSFISYAGKQAALTAQPVSVTRVDQPSSPQADILVAGSVAVDLSCDYVGGKSVVPPLHVSNPAAIRQTIGGVGHNVALAAHRLSPSLRVKLCSLVGDDLAGSTVLSAMQAEGLDTSGVRRLGRERDGARTAQYVAVNGADKNLMVAMADMGIFTSAQAVPDAAWAANVVAEAAPRWLVVDGNWSAAGVQRWVAAARQAGVQTAFEPVSAAKASVLFEVHGHNKQTLSLVDLATPNQHELAAMHTAARSRSGCLTEDPRWFEVIDALGLRAGARERSVRLTSMALVDAGVPVQMLQLLPYVPTLVTKLGADGALLARLLKRDDPLLYDPAAEAYLLVRAPPSDVDVGGVYMRLFPARQVDASKMASVNGAGDTFLGALVSGLAQGGRVEELIDVAQQASVQTLYSPEAVSGEMEGVAEALAIVARRS